ncbi:hypothetical protein LTR10_007448 [Elasticomyces elasticus]|nr:hypothetical protein LTR10_007448 [Elasticomyces elasticus]KAK4979258.1 hypothetical protein LTR42_001761 [Elasticomyces elasticus]
MATRKTTKTTVKRPTRVATTASTTATATATTVDTTYTIFGVNAPGQLLNSLNLVSVRIWIQSMIQLTPGEFVLEQRPQLALGESRVFCGEDLIHKYEEHLHTQAAEQTDTSYAKLVKRITDNHLRITDVGEEHHAVLKAAWSTELSRLVHNELEEYNVREAQKEEKKNN